jgi:predicted acetylornithine/succinylornithine family transaminase
MTSSADYKALEAKYYTQVVNRRPMVLTSAKGTRVFDNDGNSYLDFTAGWAVLNIGHSHPKVVEAVREQAGLINQMSNLFYTTPQLKLAQILIDNSCLDRVFFCNSGAEANEGVSKLARKWGKLNLNDAYEIITANNSFHGRTMGMMAATGQAYYQDAWRPLMPGFVNVDFDDMDAIKAATNDKTCAVMVEPVQGEGGVNVPADDYLRNIQDWCESNNLMFIVDEVQTGMGRLGKLFGHQLYDVEPHAMTLAKALGSGAPLGAFLCQEKYSVLVPGDHGSTFGGNALTTASGAAAAEVIVDEDIPTQAAQMGAYVTGKLNALKEKHTFITEVRGPGLLIGIEMTKEIAPDVVTEAESNGLLLNAIRPTILRLMPPLNVSREEVDEALGILDAALEKIG